MEGDEVNVIYPTYGLFQIMNSDIEQDEPNRANRRDIELKIERFREQSQVYLCRLPLLKRQLHEINRLQQFELYVQKLGTNRQILFSFTLVNIDLVFR